MHSFIHGYLGCFCLLTAVNNAAMNMGVQISIPVPAFNYLGFICRSGIAGSYGNSMFIILIFMYY